MLAASAGATAREYWIQAEQVNWNIVPTGRDAMMDKKVKGKTKFTAYAYRRYSPGFAAPLGPATIPGPLIEAEIGDTVVVNFRNKLDAPVTIHPHGVFYDAGDGRRLQGPVHRSRAASCRRSRPSSTSGRRARAPRAPGSTTTTGRWTRCRSTRACSGR